MQKIPTLRARLGRRPQPRDPACPNCGNATRFNHWPDWLPCDPLRQEDRWYYAAALPTEDGAYELCGPKINGNPERLERHAYFRHGAEPLAGLTGVLPFAVEIAYDALRAYLAPAEIEGVVWHHPDGRMAKIKARDFGIRWPR